MQSFKLIFGKKKLASAFAVTKGKMRAKFDFNEPQVGFERAYGQKLNYN